jgi:hypothetical protein
LPIACGAVADGLARPVIGQSLFTVPVVALTMGIQAASLDYLLVRIFMRRSVRRRFILLLVGNVLSASVTLGLGFAWVAHHPTMVFDVANKCLMLWR